MTVRDVSPDQAVRHLERDDAVVLDVRTPSEHAAGHVSGCVLIDFHAPDFAQRLDALDRDRAYLLYCRSGTRSGEAAKLMTAMGFANVTNIGGFEELVAAGAPAEH